MLLTLNLASIALAFWLIPEWTRISTVAKSYLWSALFTGGEPYRRVKIVIGISQTIRHYQGYLVMACEKLHILIVKHMKT